MQVSGPFLRDVLLVADVVAVAVAVARDLDLDLDLTLLWLWGNGMSGRIWGLIWVDNEYSEIEEKAKVKESDDGERGGRGIPDQYVMVGLPFFLFSLAFFFFSPSILDVYPSKWVVGEKYKGTTRNKKCMNERMERGESVCMCVCETENVEVRRGVTKYRGVFGECVTHRTDFPVY